MLSSTTSTSHRLTRGQQNCKLDACADLFSSRLYSLKPDYCPGWNEREPKWEAFPENELKKVTEELEQHVRRLVPGFLKDNEAVLKKKEFKDRLSTRWEPMLSGLRSGADKQDQDWVPRPLLDVLSDRQHKQRTRKSRPTPPGDHKAFVESCRQLKGFIGGEQAMASFACGGTIPIAVPGTETTSPTSAPVNIF